MNQRSRLDQINGIAVLLAMFSFGLSPWLGTRSGLTLLFELGDFLRSSSPDAQIGRQQAIFAILIGILFCLIVQALAFGFSLRTGNRRFLFQEMLFALMGVTLLGTLFFAFQAQTLGVVVTAASALIAALAALMTQLRSAQPAQPVAASAAPLPRAENAKTADPIAQADLDDSDPMLAFQRKVAQTFHDCRKAGDAFSLAMVGIAEYDMVTDVFGTDTAQEMLDVLTRFARESDERAVVTAFSTGAVMVAMPGSTKHQAQTHMTTLGQRMSSHGFPGEMLLPDGHIHLTRHVVSFPEDGNNLAQLTEQVLVGYAAQGAE